MAKPDCHFMTEQASSGRTAQLRNSNMSADLIFYRHGTSSPTHEAGSVLLQRVRQRWVGAGCMGNYHMEKLPGPERRMLRILSESGSFIANLQSRCEHSPETTINVESLGQEDPSLKDAPHAKALPKPLRPQSSAKTWCPVPRKAELQAESLGRHPENASMDGLHARSGAGAVQRVQGLSHRSQARSKTASTSPSPSFMNFLNYVAGCACLTLGALVMTLSGSYRLEASVGSWRCRVCDMNRKGCRLQRANCQRPHSHVGLSKA